MTRTHQAVIIGAGPAGLTAAAVLRDRGVEDVLIIDREQEAGGAPRHCGHRVFGLSQFKRLLSGPGYVRRLVQAAAGVPVLCGVTVTALHPGGKLDIVTPDGPERIAARCVLLATGARETPRAARLVSGGRPWGVLTTGALQQFVYLSGRKPFVRAVIVGTESVAFSALVTMRRAGIRPVAMLEPGRRVTTYRPAEWAAKLVFGTPVLTETKVTDIEGRARVEAVVIEHRGEKLRLPCDGIVFTGRFVPEAALVRASHLALDDATGGPRIDQYWRSSDPAYFAAGNVLRPVETAGVAALEGRAAALAMAENLAGRLPPPERAIPVEADEPIRFVYPQVIAQPGAPPGPLLFRARVSREVRGRLRLLVNGREAWSRRIHALPERRLRLPGRLVNPARLESVRVEIAPD